MPFIPPNHPNPNQNQRPAIVRSILKEDRKLQHAWAEVIAKRQEEAGRKRPKR